MSTTPDQPANRRRARRIPCKVEVDVSHGADSFRGRILDLTVYGAFLSSPDFPSQASMVRLTFRVSAEREIIVKGRIAWSRPREGAGIEFVDIKPENKREIQEYLAELE